MNYIIMDEKYITAFTDSIDAETHKHYMLQLFMSCNDNLNIEVKGEQISCKFIIVNTNVDRCFFSENELYFTILIDSTSDIAEGFKKNYLIERDYAILDSIEINSLQKLLNETINNINFDRYKEFIHRLFSTLSIEINERKIYDKRITKLLKMLNEPFRRN